MALKKSFLTNFLKSGSGKEEAEENAESAAELRREQHQAQKEQKEQKEQKKPPEPETDPALLQLPEDHAFNRLWRLRSDKEGWLPLPVLRMRSRCGEQEVGPVDETLKKELLRLQVNITASANKRAAKAFPKGEEEPPVLDAEATVFVTGDKITAWMVIYPPVGEGSELNGDMLTRVLQENKVSYGLQKELLEELPEREDRYFHLFLVARGEQPINGTDGNVIDLFPRSVQVKAAMDEFGKIDYTSLNLVQNVQEGELICRIVPPTVGMPGISVFNQEIAAKDGKPVAAPAGRNTKLTEDGSALVATRMGHVEFSGRGFQVNPVLDIAGNVDYSTGSINFLGDVHIHGDVCSGFDVRATGSIVVDGVVEASSLEAGGNLTLVKGVQGNDQAVIRSHRGIFAKFLENSRVYAKENLMADCILNCEAFSDGEVAACSGRGVIIGGNIRAAHGINARILGSRTECPTYVSVGGLPCEDSEYERLEEELWKLEEELDRTAEQPDGKVKTSRMSKLREKIQTDRARMEQFEQDLNRIKDNTKEKKTGQVTFGIAYRGTVIRIEEAVLRLEKEERQGTARLVEGEVSLA